MKRALFLAPLLLAATACSSTNHGPAAYPAGTSPTLQLAALPDEVAADYQRVVQRVAAMVDDSRVIEGARRRGLDVVNVTWEDTGRAEGSSLGPNITDLTLQVRYLDGSGFHTELMPVIRFPNFTDRTGDVPAEKLFVRVGNEHGRSLTNVPLTEVLGNLHRFATVPASLADTESLLAPRDSHFLVSAQAVFLPIPKAGKAEFNPVVFNYQSAPESPAVLTLLVTRQGTSVRVIENRPEDLDPTVGWGQELYFNNAGQRAAFTAERKSDVERRIARQGGPRSEDDQSALARGADVLFLVQVPLKHRNRGVLGGPLDAMAASAPCAAPMMEEAEASADDEHTDVEQAVLGHGPDLGPYVEGYGTTLVRDPRFPIRVTVQFYKATSNGIVSEGDLDGIASNIGNVYEHADYVGSLVVPERPDRARPTAWQSRPNQWFAW